MESNYWWDRIKFKKRIVIKVGSSTLTQKEDQKINEERLEELVKTISKIKESGKDVILVSSGAIAVGREVLNIGTKPKSMEQKQACAAIGQCKLMMHYYNLFSKYNQIASQVLMTKFNLNLDKDYCNLKNTFGELLRYGSIPVVNENDAIATDEIELGDNDTLAAIVSAITEADLLIMLTDIDGLYTDDPFKNRDAKFIETVDKDTESLINMAKETSDSDVGTGGMKTKILAAQMLNHIGTDTIIAKGENPSILTEILDGKHHGTLFVANKEKDFETRRYLMSKIN